MEFEMKKLLLIAILASTLNAAIETQTEVLIPTVSVHNQKTNSSGYKYNSVHYGIGLRHKHSIEGTDFYVCGNALTLLDSYKHMMYIASVGSSCNVYDSIYVGFEAGATLKYKNKKYRFLPVGAIDLSYQFDSWSVNITHTPRVSYDGFHSEGVTLLMVGIKI